jgi:hypothetical protein
MSSGAFSRAQPLYAEHGIATFPVRIVGDDKKPAIKHYMKVGLPGSAKLAMRFENDNALGFMLGDRTRLTILDVDTRDERVVAQALDRHGHSPLIVRTARRKYHAYYRHNREHRLIRPWPDRPIDCSVPASPSHRPPPLRRAPINSSKAALTTSTDCRSCAIWTYRKPGQSRARGTEASFATA